MLNLSPILVLKGKYLICVQLRGYVKITSFQRLTRIESLGRYILLKIRVKKYRITYGAL